VPLSSLAGVLVVVCWYMVEKKEFVALLRNWPTAIVLAATFGLTILKDLTTGIIVGCALAGCLPSSTAKWRKKAPDQPGALE